MHPVARVRQQPKQRPEHGEQQRAEQRGGRRLWAGASATVASGLELPPHVRQRRQERREEAAVMRAEGGDLRCDVRSKGVESEIGGSVQSGRSP